MTSSLPSTCRALTAGALVVLSAVTACTREEPKATGKSRPGKHEQAAAGDVVIGTGHAPYRVINVSSAGAVAGTITLRNAPPLQATSTGPLGPVCGGLIPDLSVQQQGNGLAGAVVWLDGVAIGKAPGAERRLELESDHCKLVPRVQAAYVGSAVNIIGHDAFLQHLRFAANGETAPRASILLGGGEQVIPTELPFRTPGLVTVSDPGHSWTKAYLAVFDHPYYAVSAQNGVFTIDGVPPGTYTLKVWHERTGVTQQPVRVAAGEKANVNVELRSTSVP